MGKISSLPKQENQKHKNIETAKICFVCGSENWTGVGLVVPEFQEETKIKTVKTILFCPQCCRKMHKIRERALLLRGTICDPDNPPKPNLEMLS